jgi:hypothetical protein
MSAQKPLELILARNLLSSISTPAFLVSDDGSLLFFNESAAAMLGRRFEETGTMTAAQWTGEFGPFGPDEKPIPYEQIPATVALRTAGPFTVTSASARLVVAIKMWPRARSRSSERAARAALS